MTLDNMTGITKGSYTGDMFCKSQLITCNRVKKCDGVCPKINQIIHDALSAEDDWIPVSERLPSEPFGCIVTVWDSTPTGEGDDFENILPYFVGWDGEQWNDGDGEQCPFEVIAWMPLPEPYKAESEEV